MSTFSGLNTAYTGLSAARQGMSVTGQNVTNVNTEGYTRQRIETSAMEPIARTGLFAQGATPGQGVSVEGISRLGDVYADTRVRTAAAGAGYSSVRSEALYALEGNLKEPGANGMSSQLQRFWNSWQNLSNQPGDPAPTSVLLHEARALASGMAEAYAETDALWSRVRSEAGGTVNQLNTAAAEVADINSRIRSRIAAGESANELIDRRSMLTESIASLSGAAVRQNPDGTVDVTIAGSAIVSGDSFRPVRLAGAAEMRDTATGPVQLEWAHRPGTPIAVDGGKIAGSLSLLAPANGNGTGGTIAETAASYDAFARSLAESVNAVHRTGASVDGSTDLAFFAFTPGVPTAAGLTVVPTDANGIATGTPGAGTFDGGVADAISRVKEGKGSPDTQWNEFVVRLGADTRGAARHDVLAQSGAISAKEAQLSRAAVSLDEENVNLLAYQHAYQASARVMSAVDEMLDVLINRTGLVGR